MPQNRFERRRDQMRFRLVHFADFAFRIGAGRVEVPRRHPLQAVRNSVPMKHALDKQLGFAVGVHRLLRFRFGDRNCIGIPVHGARRGEHNVLRAAGRSGHPRSASSCRRSRGNTYPDPVRLADLGFGGEIDYLGDAVLANDLLDQFAVLDIALVERTELRGPAMAGAEIVQNDGLTPGFSEQLTCVASDIAGAAGYQNGICQFTLTSGGIRDSDFL